MNGRPLSYDSDVLSAAVRVSACALKPLKTLPILGDIVRLAVPGPPMIVVDCPKTPQSVEDDAPPFDAPIGVVYCDGTGHVSRGVVPFGCLCSYEVKERF